jgi:hypothetical protein
VVHAQVSKFACGQAGTADSILNEFTRFVSHFNIFSASDASAGL